LFYFENKFTSIQPEYRKTAGKVQATLPNFVLFLWVWNLVS